MAHTHKIISLDPNKAWYEEINNVPAFKKITTFSEVELLQYAKNVLDNKFVYILGHRFFIKVPDVYNWDNINSILTMSYCKGENLECLLCEPTTRNFGIELLQAMLKFILDNNFYWYDFAPRNILVDSSTIYLVDFEKGIDDKIKHLKLFLRNHVFEEYSSFLLRNERIFNTDFVYSLYDGETDKPICITDIKVKRFKSVALQLGYTDTITLSQLLDIQKRIINAEEPYYHNGQIIFPRIQLVKMLENKVSNPNIYHEYAKLIVSQK